MSFSGTRTLSSAAQKAEAVVMKVKSAPEGVWATTEEELLKKESVTPDDVLGLQRITQGEECGPGTGPRDTGRTGAVTRWGDQG